MKETTDLEDNFPSRLIIRVLLGDKLFDFQLLNHWISSLLQGNIGVQGESEFPSSNMS